MSDPILSKAHVEFTIDGVRFVTKRRSTFLLAQAGGMGKVLGLMAGAANSADITKERALLDDYASMVQAVVRVALVQPRIAEEGEEPNPPESYSYEQIAPFADAIYAKVMSSGFDLNP